MLISLPRTRRMSGSDRRSRSRPRNGHLPPAILPGGVGTSRMMESDVTDLPLPISHDRQRLASTDSEADAIHRAHSRAIDVEQDLEVIDLQQWRHSSCQPRSLGSSMSRRASPNRLVPNTARLIATPGRSPATGGADIFRRRFRQHRPHDGDRPGNAEAEERQRGLGEDGGAEVARSPARSAAPACWAARGGTRCGSRSCRSIGGLDERQFAQRQRVGADHAGDRGDQRNRNAMITFGSDGPSAAVITSASTSKGRACRISVMRWNTRSTQPEQIARGEADEDAE